MAESKRYEASAEAKKKLNDAFAGFNSRTKFKYTPGGATKKKVVKRKTARKSIAGTAYGRDADAVLRRIEAGK